MRAHTDRRPTCAKRRLRLRLRMRAALAAGAVLIAVPWLLACGPEPIDRPNIVLIIGDDHGYPDSGFMGNEIVKTPNLDRLAASGTVFTNAWNTGSTCRPSLMTLLTGLQPYQMELWVRKRHRAPLLAVRGDEIKSFETLPSLLALRGYRSFQAGKLWEGTFEQAGFSGGTKGRDLDGPPIMRLAGGQKGLEIGRSTMQPVWDFLQTGSEPGSGAGSEPFFLWFAPMLPHVPMDASREVRARYDGIPLAESALAYYANVSRLDDAIGELVAKLDELGLRERTLIVYLSDNGWDNRPDVDHPLDAFQLGGPNGKMSMHELGFRTPLVFSWPGRVPGGRVRDELVSSLDMFPTLLDFAGLQAPPGREGIDLRPVIEQQLPVPVRTIYGSMENARGSAPVSGQSPGGQREGYFARTPRWHFTQLQSAHSGRFGFEEELFDMQEDPLESENVLRAHPDVAIELRAEIDAWRKRMRASLPDPKLRDDAWRKPAAPKTARKPRSRQQQPLPAGSGAEHTAGSEAEHAAGSGAGDPNVSSSP